MQAGGSARSQASAGEKFNWSSKPDSDQTRCGLTSTLYGRTPRVNVERIFISPERAAPQIECDKISVESGGGVVGDRNFGKNIHPGQNITLVEAEEI